MKRPVILLFAATLLASGAAFAKNDKERFADKVAHAAVKRDHRDQGHERREDRRDDRRHDRRDDRRDDRRHDWNDRPNPGRDHDRRDWNDRRDHDRRGGWDRPRNDWHRHPNYWDNRRHDRHDHAVYRYHYGRYVPPRGYYYRAWHRGDRLPRGWYAGTYVVHDWRPYRLYAPPYGYHWVRVGNDVVLTAIATGIVLDVLYDIWY